MPVTPTTSVTPAKPAAAAPAASPAAFRYKITADGVGPWNKGDIITQADIDKNPQFGGVARLRDELHAIEDHFDAPPPQPAPGTVNVTRAGVPNA